MCGQYPPGLLDQLQEASQGAFDDAAAAFPNQAKPPSRNLRHFIAGASPLHAPLSRLGPCWAALDLLHTRAAW